MSEDKINHCISVFDEERRNIEMDYQSAIRVNDDKQIKESLIKLSDLDRIIDKLYVEKAKNYERKIMSLIDAYNIEYDKCKKSTIKMTKALGYEMNEEEITARTLDTITRMKDDSNDKVKFDNFCRYSMAKTKLESTVSYLNSKYYHVSDKEYENSVINIKKAINTMFKCVNIEANDIKLDKKIEEFIEDYIEVETKYRLIGGRNNEEYLNWKRYTVNSVDPTIENVINNISLEDRRLGKKK